MKPRNYSLLPFLAAISASVCALPAATINLDIATTNPGGFTLGSGNNDFSFAGFSVDYLIVGGGGGGGAPRNNAGRAGGGGGAGGLRQGTTSISGSQSIVVGAGGAGTNTALNADPNRASNGGNSSAFTLTALGGGGGGTNNSGQQNGAAGGSGGGGGFSTGGAGTSGQGNAGAAGNGSNIGGGGGGAGAGASGVTGGAGLSLSITGSAVTYAQGGAGGTAVSPVTSTPAAAAANTGNGGLGIAMPATNPYAGGAGGSGIVVARYTGPQVLTGGIVSTVAGDTVHTFNSSASLALFSATINGNIDGTGNLVWDKTGTLTLGGMNIYTGNTAVNAGIALLTGSINNTADLIFGGGMLNLGSTGVINVLQSNYSVSDANNDITGGSIFGSDTLGVTTFNDGFNNFTRIAVIPEPSAALLGGIGVLLLLRRRRD